MVLKLRSFLYLAGVFAHIVSGNPQAHFAAEDSKRVINDNLRSYIAELREKWSIPGLTLGIVRPDGEVEMEGFGNMNEDGDPVTPRVRPSSWNMLECS